MTITINEKSELITVHIPKHKTIIEVVKHLTSEYESAASIKSKSVRKTMQNNIKTLIGFIKNHHVQGKVLNCNKSVITVYEPTDLITSYRYRAW